MYQLNVTFNNGKKLKGNYTEKELRKILKKKFKKSVRYAVVITPSGVTKDVTKIFDPFAY